ncbi:MAG: hypothetical protein DRG50_09335, partial [Deltaproteobacteria bacterium]
LIKDGFFSRTARDVEEVDLILTLTDKEARQWTLPLKVPVYRTPAIFRELVGPKETSISLEVIQPQNGAVYEHEVPESLQGRFTVKGSRITSITATLDGRSLSVSINQAAGTFTAPLEGLENGKYILIVKGRNSAGDEDVEIVSFTVMQPL